MPDYIATVNFDVKELKKAFAEVAPMYSAQHILRDWLDKHGFFVSYSEGMWYVHESSHDRAGLMWGKPFIDYASVLTAVLDEIVKRAQEGTE